MCVKTCSSGGLARPGYCRRPLPKTARLIRAGGLLPDSTDNRAGVPFPERGRRKWLEKLALARYEPTQMRWKSTRR